MYSIFFIIMNSVDQSPPDESFFEYSRETHGSLERVFFGWPLEHCVYSMLPFLLYNIVVIVVNNNNNKNKVPSNGRGKTSSDSKHLQKLM